MPHGRPDFAEIKGPVLGHFGTEDQFVLVGHAKNLAQEIGNASSQAVKFEFYEGAGHAFFNDTNRLGTYDQGAAELSWGRTLDFLRSNLG